MKMTIARWLPKSWTKNEWIKRKLVFHQRDIRGLAFHNTLQKKKGRKHFKPNTELSPYRAQHFLAVSSFGFIISHAAKQQNQQRKRKIVNASKENLAFDS